MKILIDMDGVIANFEKSVLDTYQSLYPTKPFIPLDERTTFYVKEQYPSELQSLVESIYLTPGFYQSLPIINGAAEALSEMTQRGHNLFICTAPLPQYEHCVLEKYQWVDQYLGAEWVKKIIVTNDKTLVRGDILIDDKLNITGLETPTWEHILFNQPYNKHITSKKRLNWDNWKSILDI